MRETELRNLGYRFLVAEKYIMIYRLIGDTVFVYHIFDGRSDYPTLFRSELFKLKSIPIPSLPEVPINSQSKVTWVSRL